ncbi:hypothetical protein BKA70DRAFT_1228940 [Coprinopsis sp. MPI-PUGE-AT-0042]|nr:hypothetical protein BKA70DRAFT_1228940 [Coprinopsis sp. MPI-PUGE-AT-0042]
MTPARHRSNKWAKNAPSTSTNNPAQDDDGPEIPEKGPDIHTYTPSYLRLSESARKEQNYHASLVGQDIQHYNYSICDQATAISFFVELGLHLPDQEELMRDAQSKLVIIKTVPRNVDKKHNSDFACVDRYFQCQCGIYYEEGQHASKNRQMGWENIACPFWVKLITVYRWDKKTELLVMECAPRVPLHPELRDETLRLLQEGHNIYMESSVYQRSSAKDNLDKWFQAKDPSPPSPLLTQSNLHYQAHTQGQTDHFEFIICTPEMKKAAWEHGHKWQVLMDLTFGFCSTPALLLILMAVDKETGRGLPIGFILFTPKEKAKAVHADYNTEILTRLLRLYKERLAQVGKTDSIALFDSVRKRLARFIRTLLYDIKDYEEALKAYNAEKRFWDQASRGAAEAAQRLGMALESFARTNNPLESFNGHFKNEYIEPYEHSGHLVQIDLWVQLVITDVMPKFFDKIEKTRQNAAYKDGLRYLKKAPAPAPVHDSYDKRVKAWFDALEAGATKGETDDNSNEPEDEISDVEGADTNPQASSDSIIDDMSKGEPMQIENLPPFLPANDEIIETSVDEERELVIGMMEEHGESMRDEVVDTSVIEEKELEISQELNLVQVECGEEEVDAQYINHRANLMMQMNALHDELKAIVVEFVHTAKDPIEVLGTIDELISPEIQDHLRNSSWSSSSSSYSVASDEREGEGSDEYVHPGQEQMRSGGGGGGGSRCFQNMMEGG